MEKSTVVSPGIHIRGKVTGQGSVVYAGKLDGELTVDGDVRVAPKAALAANIQANSIAVEGAVRGHLKSGGAINVGAGAEVDGTIEAGTVDIDPKARIKAKLVMPVTLPRGVKAAKRSDDWGV